MSNFTMPQKGETIALSWGGEYEYARIEGCCAVCATLVWKRAGVFDEKRSVLPAALCERLLVAPARAPAPSPSFSTTSNVGAKWKPVCEVPVCANEPPARTQQDFIVDEPPARTQQDFIVDECHALGITPVEAALVGMGYSLDHLRRPGRRNDPVAIFSRLRAPVSREGFFHKAFAARRVEFTPPDGRSTTSLETWMRGDYAEAVEVMGGAYVSRILTGLRVERERLERLGRGPGKLARFRSAAFRTVARLLFYTALVAALAGGVVGGQALAPHVVPYFAPAPAPESESLSEHLALPGRDPAQAY